MIFLIYSAALTSASATSTAMAASALACNANRRISCLFDILSFSSALTHLVACSGAHLWLVFGKQLPGLADVDVLDIVCLFCEHLHWGVLVDGHWTAGYKVLCNFTIIFGDLDNTRLQHSYGQSAIGDWLIIDVSVIITIHAYPMWAHAWLEYQKSRWKRAHRFVAQLRHRRKSC